jgi:glycosyltransferase involved in cell wall biosynthesis
VTAVHVVVPDGIDDPKRPSGGNTYDRHVCRGLTSIGWTVHEHAVPDSPAALAEVVQRIPDGAVVLLDGLVASTAPDVLVPQASRLRLVVLVHMPLGHGEERKVLSAAAAVVTTSEWARSRLLELHALPAGRVHVAAPGVEPAGLAPGTAAGGALLCVAAVTPVKGHDVLLDALATIADLPWHCTCVGSLERDPGYAERLPRDRVDFLGPRVGADLERCYAAADLVVLASREESYGMVITEALARGLPVAVTEVGGVTEAVGHGTDGARPGLLVAPEDPAALGTALRAWLGDADLRARLRRTARERRASLTGWATTTSVVAGVLAGVSR